MTSPGEPLASTNSLPVDPAATGSYHARPDEEPTSAELLSEEGTALGPYRLLRQVRTWEHGTIYEARHARLQRTVLLHALEGEAAGCPVQRAAFDRFFHDLS
jgi:hypothetical protein